MFGGSSLPTGSTTRFDIMRAALPPGCFARGFVARTTNRFALEKEGALSADQYSFSELRDFGYGSRLIPIIPTQAPLSERSTLFQAMRAGKDNRGKAPGLKGADGKWRGFPDWLTHQATEQDLMRWADMGAGFGIKCGDGLVAIDADTMSETLAKLIKETAEMILGAAPIRVGRYPKAIYLYRTTEPYAYARIEFDGVEGEPRERVEILSEGRQFVASGIHPKTGKPYNWPRSLVASDQLPAVTPEKLDEFLNVLREKLPKASPVSRQGSGAEVDQATLRGDLDTVRRAVRALPNTSELFPAREDYLSVGYAIKAALPDHPSGAFEVYSGWCERWEDGTNDPDVVRSDWERMKPPFRRGAPWLYELADRHSDGQFRLAHVWFEPVSERGPPKSQRAGLFKSVAQFCGEFAPPSYIIEPFLLSGYLYTLTAKTGAGKTAFNIAAALAVASGRSDILGKEVVRGRVAYLACENPDDIRMRIMIAAFRFGIDLDELGERIVILDSRVKPEEALVELKALAEREPFALVIVDTLPAFFDGDDFDKAKPAGEFMRRLRRFTEIAGRPAVLVSAHPVKSAEESGLVPYGSGAILNEVDGNFALRRENTDGEIDEIELSWKGKLRGLSFAAIRFRIERATCPTVVDSKGRHIRLPVLRPASMNAKGDEPVQVDKNMALLRAAHDNPQETIRARAERLGWDKSAVDRGHKQLEKRGLMRNVGRRWEVTEAGRKALAEESGRSPSAVGGG